MFQMDLAKYSVCERQMYLFLNPCNYLLYIKIRKSQGILTEIIMAAIWSKKGRAVKWKNALSRSLALKNQFCGPYSSIHSHAH